MTTVAVAHVRPDIFEPPPTPIDGRRRWRRRIAGALVAVFAATGLLWGGNVVFRDLVCGGSGDGVALVDGQCVGVTEGAYTFDPLIADIQKKIKEENENVRNGTYGDQPYVRVAVLMPMTMDDRSALSMERIRRSLWGAYVAQRRANSPDGGLGDPTPLVELLLANEGSNQEQWRPVVDQLAGMTTGEHPLVAVIGLGVSVDETQRAAEELSRHQVATVGAVLTADGLEVDDSFVRVSPSNSDYVEALREYLAYRDDLDRGMVVYDTYPDDLYTRTLRTAYEEKLGDYLVENHHSQPFNGLRDPSAPIPRFDVITRNICDARADMVFYAGRVNELEGWFIPRLAEHHCADRSQLTIFLGATGLSSLRKPETLEHLKAGNIRVVHASSTDPGRWNADAEGTPKGYATFLAEFRKEFRPQEQANEELADGYAIMHHDAVLAAVMATRQAVEEWGEPIPNHEHVTDELWKLNNAYEVPGASGSLSFSPDRSGWPSGKPVPIVSIPSDASPPVPTSGLYIT